MLAPWLDDDGELGCDHPEPGAMRASTAVGASPDGWVLDYLSGTTVLPARDLHRSVGGTRRDDPARNAARQRLLH